MKKLTLEQRYNKLDDMMQMWFRQETMIKAWNKNADRRNREMQEFNDNKKWWQPKKRGHYPRYHETPIRMPLFILVPPTYHKQYEETKKLIEDYVNEVPA